MKAWDRMLGFPSRQRSAKTPCVSRDWSPKRRKDIFSDILSGGDRREARDVEAKIGKAPRLIRGKGKWLSGVGNISRIPGPSTPSVHQPHRSPRGLRQASKPHVRLRDMACGFSALPGKLSKPGVQADTANSHGDKGRLLARNSHVAPAAIGQPEAEASAPIATDNMQR